MFARIVNLRIKPGRADDAIKIFDLNVLPEIKQQTGFLGSVMFTDDESGSGKIMIFWRHANDSHLIEADGFYNLQIEKFVDVFTHQPIAEFMKVGVCTFLMK